MKLGKLSIIDNCMKNTIYKRNTIGKINKWVY